MSRPVLGAVLSAVVIAVVAAFVYKPVLVPVVIGLILFATKGAAAGRSIAVCPAARVNWSIPFASPRLRGEGEDAHHDA